MLVRSAGLEPATWNLVGTCSIQLSYERPQWGRPGTSRPPLVDGVIFSCATARTGLTVLLDGFVTIPCRRALFRFSVGRGFLYPPPVGAEILKIGGATQRGFGRIRNGVRTAALGGATHKWGCVM